MLIGSRLHKCYLYHNVRLNGRTKGNARASKLILCSARGRACAEQVPDGFVARWFSPARARNGTPCIFRLAMASFRMIGDAWFSPSHICLSAYGCGATMHDMRARISRAIAGLALGICFICPVLEIFDHWDHTLKTGYDTEYMLVALALCVGLMYSVAQIMIALCGNFFVRVATCICGNKNSAVSSLCVAPLPAASESPPLFSLRI